ncbi:ATP-dependent helicase, partial [Sulfolobus sp. A20-N-F8]
TLKFLEITLYTYGKEAFCESYNRLLGKVEETPIIETLCEQRELSHKTRALKDVLNIYKVEEFKPVLIFTSRKSTAYEFEKVVSSFNVKAKVLTGDLSRYERLKLVQDARKGNVDVIISTLVGEEGIDIPEAKLLIMTDVPQSPLRFYQRLGRLIRGKESNTNDSSVLKYLVVTLTPKTPEYDNLDDALRNLYAEGVDVSYIIEKREDKGPVARVVDIVSKAGGKVLVSGIEGKNETLPDLFSDNPKSHVSEYVERAIRDGKVIYYYEPALLGEALSKVFIASYCNVGYGESYVKLCNDYMKNIGRKLLQSKSTLRIDRKSILYNYMKLVLPNELDDVMKELKSEEEEYIKLLEGKDYRVSISLSKYKANIKVQISISAGIEGVTINPRIHLSYYDIPTNVNEKFIKLNSNVVALYALVKFYGKFSVNNI